MTGSNAADDMADIVVDEYCGAILTATSHSPVAVSDIVNEFEMAPATVYRRISRLLDYDLLQQETRLDEKGDQYSVYSADFQAIKLEITSGIAYIHVVRDETHELLRVWEYK